LSEDDNTRWVASETSDVIAHPFDSGTVIAQRGVLLHTRGASEAEDT
jgi:hypothetical protein